MRLQFLAARAAFTAFLMAAAMALAAVAGVRLGLMPLATGLTLMTGATVLGLVALLLALAWAWRALSRNQGTGKRAGLIALLGSLVLVYFPLSHAARGISTPPLVDVSSDPDEPPRFVMLAKARKPGMNSPQPDPGQMVRFKGETNTASYMLHTYFGTNSANPVTKPHAYLLKTRPKMFWHAFETVKRMGWTVVDYSEQEGRIEATDTSLWFGQTADIVVRVQAAGTIGARIDIRAQEEMGTRDFGANLARLKGFFDAFRGGGY